jgi:flagellar assembly factor FliW
MPIPPAATALDIDTPFGAFSADANAVVAFAAGLPGFEGCRRFVLVSAPALEPFTCLHGLDAPHPSFLTIDPRQVVDPYQPSLSPADRRRLDATADAPLVWLSVVRLDAAGASANLRAPIVVNPARMIGLQVLEVDGPYAVDHRLAPAPG